MRLSPTGDEEKENTVTMVCCCLAAYDEYLYLRALVWYASSLSTNSASEKRTPDDPNHVGGEAPVTSAADRRAEASNESSTIFVAGGR